MKVSESVEQSSDSGLSDVCGFISLKGLLPFVPHTDHVTGFRHPLGNKLGSSRRLFNTHVQLCHEENVELTVSDSCNLLSS